MQVTGLGFNAFVDYARARCKFSFEGGLFIDQACTLSMHTRMHNA